MSLSSSSLFSSFLSILLLVKGTFALRNFFLKFLVRGSFNEQELSCKVRGVALSGNCGGWESRWVRCTMGERRSGWGFGDLNLRCLGDTMCVSCGLRELQCMRVYVFGSCSM